MVCRPGCAACCIAPSIRDPLPGMPAGKPAGMRCIHLDAELRCGLWGQPERPRVCGAFQADPDVCGSDRDDALQRIAALEIATTPS
ncbi:MAG: YkgJ family cysteine cluster protein [Gammaproteobacteria bacterium]|nr:MAG: YkgJ family cysteine cluster protein [Gammaproteobacteria bacterium]